MILWINAGRNDGLRRVLSITVDGIKYFEVRPKPKATKDV